ncbi:MAG: L-seryl-tRNA(Sec) selenium transferase [Firmicutes bacterium]|nr:L-seryl-tRNA(Sec) selenium transferase [Bacillota bacterium]
MDDLFNRKKAKRKTMSLRRVINGSGIILHSNLGRARLGSSVSDRIEAAATGYSTLEYDPASDMRQNRFDHLTGLITAVTGAEDAIVVNNNAAGCLLSFMALASGGEVLISRGELIDIGSVFRITDSLELAGSVLRDVGSTNRTDPEDYESAVNERTRAILKVHTSNYRIVGSSSDASIEELRGVARKHGLPLICDLGTGLLVDLSSYGLDEPTVGSVISAGADVVCFSADKLLGSCQAGIIAGKKEYIEKLKRHVLARSLRPGKITIAALEESFSIYGRGGEALREIPVLDTIMRPSIEIRNKAWALCKRLTEAGLKADALIMPGSCKLGGGMAPHFSLDTWAVALLSEDISAEEISARLRRWIVPVLSHVEGDYVLLDMRTIADDEIETTFRALTDVLGTEN